MSNTREVSEIGKLPELDPVVHGQLRLAVLSLLSSVDVAHFNWLRDRTGATDGNLGGNLARLEEAKYITVAKKFIGKKPTSIYRLTPAGRKALATYISALRRLLGGAL
jgi:DNA-binding HxlR family transcriptional regulator